jgi:hypothetical protein
MLGGAHLAFGRGGFMRHTQLFVRPTREEIAHRAYEIYLDEGRPAGRSVAHWCAAEAALMREKTRLARRRSERSRHRPVRHRTFTAASEISPHQGRCGWAW